MPRVIKLKSTKNASNVVGSVIETMREEELGAMGLNVLTGTRGSIIHIPHKGRNYRNIGELRDDFKVRVKNAKKMPVPQRKKAFRGLITELYALKQRVTNPDAVEIVEKFFSEVKGEYNKIKDL
jgi:hypothetical protein